MGKLTVSADPGKQAIIMSRDFNAPRDLVFATMTNPTLIPQWWGPGRLTTTVDAMDVRPGGRWRFVQRDESGNEYAFHGVYHSISAPERVVNTFEFEGMPGHVLLETLILEEHAGTTTVTNVSVFQSVADRDGMLQSGMEDGASESWERLAELL